MHPLDFLEDELRSLESQGLRRRARPIDGSQGTLVVVDGRRAANFCSNNYLGLADSPALRAAARTALDEEGFGSGASRLIVGNLASHRRLEEDLAAFHGAPSALLFNSGYQANVGVLSALAGAEDVIFSDELNHASLIDGCRLSRARVRIYPHADLERLGALLASERAARRRFLVSDTIFSMDGDLAPVAELRRLANAHNAILVLDEAHATGVLGPQGRGAAALAGVRADVHIATLSKAFGSFGAYVVGPLALTEYLANRARSFVFTTALPPSVAAASRAAVQIVGSPTGEALRERLAALVTQFADGLRSLGLLAPTAGRTPIFPILVGDERRAMEACEALLARGIFAQGIRPPTVPRGTSRLRFTLMATHAPEHIDQALDALAELARRDFFPRSTP